VERYLGREDRRGRHSVSSSWYEAKQPDLLLARTRRESLREHRSIAQPPFEYRRGSELQSDEAAMMPKMRGERSVYSPKSKDEEKREKPEERTVSRLATAWKSRTMARRRTFSAPLWSRFSVISLSGLFLFLQRVSRLGPGSFQGRSPSLTRACSCPRFVVALTWSTS
jgi:hypothetical protein